MQKCNATLELYEMLFVRSTHVFFANFALTAVSLISSALRLFFTTHELITAALKLIVSIYKQSSDFAEFNGNLNICVPM